MTDSKISQGIITTLVEKFLGGQLSIILIIVALSLGATAIVLTPREEDPQIVVPLADIYVRFPGASAEEVEKLVATPLERLLWQIDGVEYVYSVSRRDMAIVTVRFYVGEDRERSFVKLNNKISSHFDAVPPGVSGWVIKPIEIDDVPIVTFTLFSDTYDDHALRRVGEEVLARLDTVKNVSRTRIVGGRRLEIRVELDRELLLSRGQSPLEVARVLSAADVSLSAGSFDQNNTRYEVDSGPFITSIADVENLVIGVHDDRPVYIRDVARVYEGAEEAESYTRIGIGPADESGQHGSTYPAVTLAVAKKKGTNAVAVADAVLAKFDELRAEVVPSEIDVRVTRNSGKTADAKVNELLFSLLFAMLAVVGLLLFTLGGREGLIVALAVPISFSLALFVNMLFGFTINRVTLFALILTLGLVVDDPITNVDNIQRHILLRRRGPKAATLWAVQEVLPPVIMSTLTIIVSFLPMFFITGMMGPYMSPMAINVPLTVAFSTLSAICIVPWAAYRLLRHKGRRDEASNVSEADASSVSEADAEELESTQALQDPMVRDATLPRRVYRRLLSPFLDSHWRRLGLLGGVALLLLFSAALPVARLVPMKMLPFDNKDEFQLVLDLDEGTTLEATDGVVRQFEDYLFTVPEITDFESYTGTHSPIDFNGLVRHYYLRNEPHLADIRINLVPRDRREQKSHEIALRLRRDLEEIASRNGVQLAIVETPPGPPVLSTLVAEVYGPPGSSYDELIAASRVVADQMESEAGVVDVDSSALAPHTRLRFLLDKEKAGLHGISTNEVVETLRVALSGTAPATLHRAGERTPLPVRVEFPRSQRSGGVELGRVAVKGSRGELVPLEELGEFREVEAEAPIFHKNLERFVYVIADTAGRAPAEAVLDLGAHFRDEPLAHGMTVEWAGEGEWDITLRVFRDLGLAFGAALLGIFVLLVVQTGSFLMPLVIMSAIPLTAIGILPGFWLLNALFETPVGGHANPVFFTATAMIGMIALGGIVVRNSIVLIEFIQGALSEGMPLREAILESGAVRMRPIFLTAATTALGAWPITLDPIFSGLAWSLIFGLFASTAFTLFVVPVMYFMVYGSDSEPATSE